MPLADLAALFVKNELQNSVPCFNQAKSCFILGALALFDENSIPGKICQTRHQ